MSSLVTDRLMGQGRLEGNRVLVMFNTMSIVNNHGCVMNGHDSFVVDQWLVVNKSLVVNQWIVVNNCLVMRDWHDMMYDGLVNVVDFDVGASVLVDEGPLVMLLNCRDFRRFVSGLPRWKLVVIGVMMETIVGMADLAIEASIVSAEMWTENSGVRRVVMARRTVILRVFVVLSLMSGLVMVVLGLEVALMSLREWLLVVFSVIDVHLDGLFLMWSDQRAVVLIEVHLGVGVCRLPVFPIEIAVMTVG